MNFSRSPNYYLRPLTVPAYREDDEDSVDTSNLSFDELESSQVTSHDKSDEGRSQCSFDDLEDEEEEISSEEDENDDEETSSEEDEDDDDEEEKDQETGDECVEPRVQVINGETSDGKTSEVEEEDAWSRYAKCPKCKVGFASEKAVVSHLRVAHAPKGGNIWIQKLLDRLSDSFDAYPTLQVSLVALAVEENRNGLNTIIDVERLYRENTIILTLEQMTAMSDFRASFKELMRTEERSCCSGVEVAKKLVRCERRTCHSCGHKILINEKYFRLSHNKVKQACMWCKPDNPHIDSAVCENSCKEAVQIACVECDKRVHLACLTDNLGSFKADGVTFVCAECKGREAEKRLEKKNEEIRGLSTSLKDVAPYKNVYYLFILLLLTSWINNKFVARKNADNAINVDFVDTIDGYMTLKDAEKTPQYSNLNPAVLDTRPATVLGFSRIKFPKKGAAVKRMKVERMNVERDNDYKTVIVGRIQRTRDAAEVNVDRCWNYRVWDDQTVRFAPPTADRTLMANDTGAIIGGIAKADLNRDNLFFSVDTESVKYITSADLATSTKKTLFKALNGHCEELHDDDLDCVIIMR